jgi:hypothetical protein
VDIKRAGAHHACHHHDSRCQASVHLLLLVGSAMLQVLVYLGCFDVTDTSMPMLLGAPVE